MNILMINWKDMAHPRSGGAELLTENIARGLVRNGHCVTLFVSSASGHAKKERKNGYTIIRRGSLLTVRLWAVLWWFARGRKRHFDVVIDQVHGLPFYTPLYMRGVRIIPFMNEVAGKHWWRLQYAFPLGVAGSYVERASMRLYASCTWMTISSSTRQEIESCGILPQNIIVIPQASPVAPSFPTRKNTHPSLVWVGRVSVIKNVEDAIDAYCIAKQALPDLSLTIVGTGSGSYYKRIVRKAARHNVRMTGYVSEKEKHTLLSRSHIFLMPSLKEGLGLVVLEAAALGTPTIAYNVPGVRDAVLHGRTGILCDQNTPNAMAAHILELVSDHARYKKFQKEGMERMRKLSRQNQLSVIEEMLWSA